MSNNSPFESVTILSAVDDDIVPIVEAKEAEVEEKAPETFDSTSTKSEAKEAEVDENAPDTFDSTVSILDCNEPVADCKEAVATPRAVTCSINDAVTVPN